MYTLMFASFFFFNDPAPTEIYTLSLHDALPISAVQARQAPGADRPIDLRPGRAARDRGVCSGKQSFARSCAGEDRKSTRLNSSHVEISYAVFCLKKKKKKKSQTHTVNRKFMHVV